MLSILIPVYNYPISNLVNRLYQEALKLKIDFEILVQEDASNLYLDSNQNIKSLRNVSYQINRTNIGRTASRQALAIKAKFDNLLFLDADVLPAYNNFIEQFLKYNYKADVIVGGTKYEKKLIDNKYSLRWKFGNKRESKTVQNRNKKKYLSVISQCLWIKKNAFLKANKNMQNSYGMDIFFSYQLKLNNISVKHIENPIYHLGLETNEVFLLKSLQALDTLILLENQNKIPQDYSNIQRAYKKLEKTLMISPFRILLNNFDSFFKTNLISTNPKLLYFDLYRLSYYLKKKHV